MEKARVKEALHCQSCEEVSRHLCEERRELSGWRSGPEAAWVVLPPAAVRSFHLFTVRVCSETTGGCE